MRTRRVAKWLFASLCLTAVIWIGWYIVDKPPLSITVKDKDVVIDASTLGEYPTPVQRLTISSQEDGTIVDISSPSGRIALGRFVLHSGHNGVDGIVLHSSTHKPALASGAHDFTLRRGVRYRISIWRGIARIDDYFTF